MRQERRSCEWKALFGVQFLPRPPITDMPKYFVMYKNEKVDRTLDRRFMMPFLRKVQEAELKKLEDVIRKIHSKSRIPLEILDIGVGDGRIPINLSKTYLWKKIELFVGFDNSEIEVKKSKEAIKKRGLQNKIKILYFDAVNLNKNSSNEIFKHKYDLIICTYFTAGNFKPDEIKIKTGRDGLILPYPKNSLEPNRKFIKIFRATYKLLKSGGKIILGSTYIDSDINRLRQEEFYKKCGMTIITSKKDSFTATKEGFWSEKFTKERIYGYFPWVAKKKIKFISLDNYNFSRMVIVSK